jgi:hypothetical protein
MVRTVEGIVEAHRIASRRRKSGRRIWDLTLDLSPWFHNEELTFEQRRDAIVNKIRRSPWPNKNEEVIDILEELAEVETSEEFNEILGDLYDIADLYEDYRVWIKTH